LYYETEWRAKNWLGNEIGPITHTAGKYKGQTKRVQLGEFDPRPYQRHQKQRQHNQKQQEITLFDLTKLQGKPFWIWDKQEHLRLADATNEQCCFNHIVGLPQKDKIEHPLYDYEKILFDTLMSFDGSFRDKHLWIKKATGLGITEFMLRIMAWLCTNVRRLIRAFMGM
jgi:hypothetical protein